MTDHAQLTFVPSSLVPAGGRLVLWSPSDDEDRLARAAEALGLPAGERGPLATVALDGEQLRATSAPARWLPLLPVVRRLAAMPPSSDWPGWQRPSASVLAWSAAAKLALELVAAGRLLPGLEVDDVPGRARARWRAVTVGEERVRGLAARMPLAAHAVRGEDGRLATAPGLLHDFLDAVADACGRGGRRPEVDARRRGPRRPLGEMWRDALVASDPIVEHLRVPAEELVADLDDWAAPLLGAQRSQVARLLVGLQPPDTGDEEEPDLASRLRASERPWRLALHLQSLDDADAVLPAGEVWAAEGPRSLGDRVVRDPQGTLVQGLARAARLFAPLDRCLEEARPESVELTADEVAELLRDGAEALQAAGVGVRLPPELRDDATQRLRLRLRIGQRTPTAPRVEGAAPLGLSSITDLRYEIALGDETIDADEFAEIVAAGQPLVRWRGQWVRVEPEELQRIDELAGSSASLELTEALAAALSGQHHIDGIGWVEAIPEGDLGEAIERLRHADAPQEAEIVGIEGELRPYQRRGVAWLQRLTDLGMGAVLADEMGLGKTLMGIALLTSRPTDRPQLVVCPTSVVGNWERELARFAPDVPVVRHHGAERPVTRRAFRPGHVTVTSYALLRRDADLLSSVDWDVVILDEAQQVKNPSSKGARAARSLVSRHRVAMTGTPIENRLSELWAIIDLTNPGLLGSQRRFTERFAAPIERWHDEQAAARLRRLVAPFVLRRRKDDAEVSVDLPPKQELRVTCSLTREQASLYQAAVDQAFSGQGLGATTFERRGRVLALLTALKQICNHPRQYLRDDGRLEGRSGKLARATELLAEVIDSGDRALVFTQFREMGELLAEHLSSALELPEVPFLHGGVPLGARDAMVERFQSDPEAPPLLLISLRAGGTGLNLTRATHVVHVDRWWNPAVEDQATDRAHRIGQQRSVTVHTMVTAGTIEERISDLLERKRALADAVVESGETWISELGDEEIRDLVSLSTDELPDEDDEPEPAPTRPTLTALPGGRA